MYAPRTVTALGVAACAVGLSLAGALPVPVAAAAPTETDSAGDSASVTHHTPVSATRGTTRTRVARDAVPQQAQSASAHRAAAVTDQSAPPAAEGRARRNAQQPTATPPRRAAPTMESAVPTLPEATASPVPTLPEAAASATSPERVVGSRAVGRVPVYFQAAAAVARPAPASATAQVSSPIASATASAVPNLFGSLPVNSVGDFINGVLLMVRRQFFNQAPRAVPVQAMVRSSGQVWGVVLGSDPEGDRITYAVSKAPSHGTVTVSDLGVYAYTPGQDFTGTDSFTVVVKDSGFHINLLNLFGGQRTRVKVTVTSTVDPAGTVIDTFAGAAGSAPNPALWTPYVGSYLDDGLQAYTDSPDNVRLDGQGHLVIQARTTGSGYTSAKIATQGNLDMIYGSMAARIKLPEGQGIWPAFWMMGSTYSQDTWYAKDETGWPGCGEIDLMELVNSGTTYYSTLHGPRGVAGTSTYGDYYSNGQVVGTSGPISNVTNGRITDLAADYHDYWVIREPDIIVVGVDGTMLATFTPASLPAGGRWVFDQPMFAILNVAVGGPWSGPPDNTTPWPATMLVDSFQYTPTAAV